MMDRLRASPQQQLFGSERMLFAFAVVLIIFTRLFRPTAICAQPTSQYVYDSLRRLIAVYDASGNAAVYHYDAVGNLLSISNSPATQFTTIALSSSNGVAGSTTTIYGTDFCSTPTVAFNGIAANVVSSTSTQIQVTVPAGAASGEVTVMCSGNTVNAGSFTAATNAPSISGFTPTSGNPGTVVTISGQNFQSTLTNNNVQFNTAGAAVTSASTTSLSVNVPPQATTGHISVTTAYGQALSNSDFFVVPNGISPASISIEGQTAIGGDAVTASFITGSLVALYAFDGVAGQQVAVVATNNSLNSPTISILAPDGSTLASLQVSGSTGFIDAQPLQVTGTYILMISSGSSAGQITVKLTNSTPASGEITIGGPAINETLATGQDAFLTFNGSREESISLSITGSTLNCPTISILAPIIVAPDGQPITVFPNQSSLFSLPVCGTADIINAYTLPITGSYTLFIDTGVSAGSATLQLNTLAGTPGIMVGGPPVTTVLLAGGAATLSFTGAAGEEVSGLASNCTMTGSPVGIQAPNGLTIASSNLCGSLFPDAQQLPLNGTYTLFMDEASPGGATTFQLFNAKVLAGTLSVGGPAVTENPGVGQDALLTFKGKAGQELAIDVSNSSLNCPTLEVLQPTGATLVSQQVCGQSGSVGVPPLPASGTYSVFLDTGAQGGSISLSLVQTGHVTESPIAPVLGTIVVGGSAVTSALQAGQNAFLNFSGTAGETVSLNGSNITLNCPNVSILTPKNLTVVSAQMCGSGFFDAVVLPTNGTYRVFIGNSSSSTGGSATVQLSNSNEVGGSIAIGGSSVSEMLNPGQDAFLTYTAVAGQEVILSAQNITLNCPVIGMVDPNRFVLASSQICGSGFIGPQGLLTTSTYGISVDSGSQAGGITLQLSNLTDLSGGVKTSDAYARTVLADAPLTYWRFDESGPPSAINASGLQRITGPTTPDGAIALNGGDYLTTSTIQNNPGPFSEEIWFKTTTTSGGRLIGFGGNQLGTSGVFDRAIYMTNGGQLIFGFFGPYVETPNSYNDGNWHHVVGTWIYQTLSLYVDGALVGTASNTGVPQNYMGFWRLGYDNLGGWPFSPSSFYFTGSIGEAAIYNYCLTASQVSNHFATATTGKYDSVVLADNPQYYWPLKQTSGLTFADATGAGNTAISQVPSNNGVYQGGITFGQPGMVSADSAIVLDGASGYVTSLLPANNPAPFSEEIWFNTTTSNGGRLIGFGNSQYGLSGSYDRAVYMTNGGQLIFGTCCFTTVETSGSYNDGNWHHTVATWVNNTLTLYVDGALVGTTSGGVQAIVPSYWRVGYDNLNGWPSQPSSFYFAGAVDEAAIYGYALSATQVSNHYHASGR
jgi:hypothetical protein